MKVKLPVLRKNKRSVFGAAVGLNLLAMAVIVLVMRPSFETNDDIVFAEFGSGLRGGERRASGFSELYPGADLPFSVSGDGKAAVVYIFQYAALDCAAFSAVAYVLINKMEGWAGLWLSLVLLCCFGYEACIRIQFTKTGGIAAAAAVFLLFYVILQEKFHIWEFLWGIGLGLLGFMYRGRSVLGQQRPDGGDWDIFSPYTAKTVWKFRNPEDRCLRGSFCRPADCCRNGGNGGFLYVQKRRVAGISGI